MTKEYERGFTDGAHLTGRMAQEEILELKTQYTFSEMGEKLDISREWARKKYKSVLEKLYNFV